MYPQLFEVYGFFMPSYLVGQLFSIAVAALWLHLNRRDFELPDHVALDVTLLGIVCVFVGGRIESLRRTGDLLDLTLTDLPSTMNSGGFAFFGVLWMGLLGTAAYAAFHRRNVIDFWDALAPIIPLALVFYRGGCLLAGCCSGSPTSMPWGIEYPVDFWSDHEPGVAVHPLPIYEMVGSLVVYTLLRRVQKRRPPRGGVILAFFLLLGPLRFTTDLFRADAVDRMASWIPGLELTSAQWWCLLATMVSALVLLVRFLRRASAAERKRVLARGMLASCSLLLSLGVAELTVRWLGLAPELAVLRVDRPQGSFVASIDPMLRYVPMPGSPGVNSLGLRDREHRIEKDGPRVMVLGDSIAWGFCNWDGPLELSQGFPWVLEEELGIEVINLGVSGYDTAQEVRLLEVGGLRYEPDVVLIASTPNDVYPMASNEFELLKGRAGWEEHQELAMLSEHILFHSHLTRMLLVRFATPPLPEVVEGEDVVDPVERGYRRLRRLSQKHGFAVRVALFPDPSLPLDHLEDQVEAFGFESMDMGDVLDDRSDFYEPCSAMHPNPSGHRAVAEALAPFVAEALP